MSLRAFHLFFILISIVFGLGFGVWGLRNEYSLLGALSLGVAVGMVFYLSWFLRKTKKFGAGILSLILSPDLCHACSVCVGNPSSPLTQGANQGVILLLGIVISVLVGFASLFVVWGHRARLHPK